MIFDSVLYSSWSVKFYLYCDGCKPALLEILNTYVVKCVLIGPAVPNIFPRVLFVFFIIF